MKKSPKSLLTLILVVLLAITAFCVGCRPARAANTQSPKDITVTISHPDLLIIVATEDSGSTTVDYSFRVRIHENDKKMFEKKLETIDGVLSANIFDKGYTISIRRSPAFTRKEVEINTILMLLDYFKTEKFTLFDTTFQARMDIENAINIIR